VIRSFGRDWYDISKAPLPTITLNGSMIGRIVEARGHLTFEEIACFPLHAAEIDRALAVVEAVLDGGASNVLVFYYPRDWRMGELIWTPDPEHVIPIKEKYVSASAVTAVELPKLRAQLAAEDICMLFVLLDLPQDRLMAYQHTKQSMFFTSRGVDKLSGLQAMARHLDIDLTSGLGAGDTEMDGFLTAMGCAVIVGSKELPYWGSVATLRVPDSPTFGQLLWRLAELHGSPPP
jgi:hydroxymethylpyrimidine pyrophosphatase-like HAD family hydrolase